MNIVKADSTDVSVLAALADEIWHQHFKGIISDGQIEYMLEMFQCEKAMKEQFEHGYEYYLFEVDGEYQGYFAIQPKEDGTLFISKVYLRESMRGRGYARRAFEVIENRARDLGLTKTWLTVNIHNDVAIEVYKALGMHIARTQVADIGNGYVMDDYIFEKDLES